jgi:hypothetical protein
MVEIFHRRSDSFYNKKIKIKSNCDKSLKKLPSLNSLIAPGQRKEIVKKLFNNNEQVFNNLIQQLEVINDWQDAWHKVEIELNKHHIYLHNPDAIFLTNILYSRYFPEK